MKELIKKEPAQRGIERSIKCMESWAKEKDNTWNNYFREVSPQLAIHHIRGGKISPWLIFLSESGQDLWGGLNQEQILLIKDIIAVKDSLIYFDKLTNSTLSVELNQLTALSRVSLYIQTTWIRMRRRVTRRLIWIQVV